MAYEIQRNQDNAVHEREKLLLRLELLLRTENRLLPPSPLSDIYKDAQIEAVQQENEEFKKRLAALETKQKKR